MEIYIPKTTKPRKYITKSGESKQYEYLQFDDTVYVTENKEVLLKKKILYLD